MAAAMAEGVGGWLARGPFCISAEGRGKPARAPSPGAADPGGAETPGGKMGGPKVPDFGSSSRRSKLPTAVPEVDGSEEGCPGTLSFPGIGLQNS